MYGADNIDVFNPLCFFVCILSILVDLNAVFRDENKSCRETVCVFFRLNETTNYDCWSDDVLSTQHKPF